jgi:hypothetical protein
MGKPLLLATLLALTAAAPPQAAMPAWMSGDWVEEKAGGWTEEHWSAPRGGVMLGTGLNGKGAAADDFEFMRIARDRDGTLTFWGSPRSRTPVPFRAASIGRNAVMFENPKHDYPTRITYRREGDVLIAEISGPGGAHPMRWRYTRR